MVEIIPNCFYRVITKAVVVNEGGKVMLCQEDTKKWDLPGGGIDYGESIE